MGITRTEFLRDRAVVHYVLKVPPGEPDVIGCEEVRYEDVENLPLAPELPDDCEEDLRTETWEETVYLPACQRSIAFHFESFPETSAYDMECLRGGPYLVIDPISAEQDAPDLGHHLASAHGRNAQTKRPDKGGGEGGDGK
jgi:hypothetical protein